MSLDFNGAGRYVQYGSAASLDDIPANPCTFWAWIYRTSNGANQHLITKDQTFPEGFVFMVENGAGEGALRLFVVRNGDFDDKADYVSAAGLVVLNTWTFVAATWDINGGAGQLIQLYLGSLTAKATETSYATETDGTGVYTSDAGADLRVGNLHRADIPFLGRVDRGGIIRRALIEPEIQQLQSASIREANVQGTELLFKFRGSDLQYDYSGRGHVGTSTGSPVIATSLPLPLPRRRDVVARVPDAAATVPRLTLLGVG